MKTNLSKIVSVCVSIMLISTIAAGKKTHIRTNDVFLEWGKAGQRFKIDNAKFELDNPPGVVVSDGQPYVNKVDAECKFDDNGKGYVKLTLKAGRHQTEAVAKKFKDSHPAVWLTASHFTKESKRKKLPTELNFFFAGTLSLDISSLDGKEKVTRKFPLAFAQYRYEKIGHMNLWIVASKTGETGPKDRKRRSIVVFAKGERSTGTGIEADTNFFTISQYNKVYEAEHFPVSWSLPDAQDPQDDQIPDDQTPDDQDPTDD